MNTAMASTASTAAVPGSCRTSVGEGDLLPSADVAPQPGQTGATTAGIVLAILVGVLFWRFVSRPRLVALGRRQPPGAAGVAR